MTKDQLTKYIVSWNLKYPYDKKWRSKYNIPLFSPNHKQMCLADIWMEIEEERLYDEAVEEYRKNKKEEEEGAVTSLRDKPYIKGYGNWLSTSEDHMSQEEVDKLFDKIQI